MKSELEERPVDSSDDSSSDVQTVNVIASKSECETEKLYDEAPVSISSFATASRHQFFEGADRGQILDVLPLLHFEDKNCVLIEAERGYGKTSLAHPIFHQSKDLATEDSQTTIILRGSEVEHEDDSIVLAYLAKQFRIPVEARQKIDDGISLAGQYQQFLQTTAIEKSIVVVDDAQQMSSIAVTLFIEFISQMPRNKIQLILLAIPSAHVLLADSELQDYLREYGHCVVLRAYNSRETAEYVRFLLIGSERESVHLSRQAMSRIYQMSAGVPSRINEALVYALQDYDQQPSGQNRKRGIVVPKWHLVSLSLVAAGVLALIIFGNPEPKSEARFSETIRPLSDADDEDLPANSRSPQIRFSDAQAPRPLNNQRQLEDRSELEIGRTRENPSPAQSNDQVTAVSQSASESGSAPVDLEHEPREQVSLEARIAKLKAQRAQQAEPRTVPTQTMAPPPAPVSAPTAVASAASIAGMPGSAQPTSESTPKDAAWVKSMSADRYTLQLLGGANKSAIESFVKQNGSYRKMGYFETSHQGKPWYVVVYGDFSSRAQAVAAVGNLPAQLKSSNPWPRSAADVQSKMR